VNVKTKEQSKQWINTHSPEKQKMFKQTFPRKLMAVVFWQKLMAVVFWDRKGVLMVEFTQQGTTITIRSVLQKTEKLRRAIQNKMCGMPTSRVVLLHDNACLHKSPDACT
jgi:hypothetical protein